MRLRIPMPAIQTFVSHIDPGADPRLGFHHGVLLG